MALHSRRLNRIITASQGGIAMFVWSSLAHMVLPLSEAGIREIPSEPAVLKVMNESIGRVSGFSVFPGMGLRPDATKEEKHAAMQQYEQKFAMYPSGILIYHPPGAGLMRGWPRSLLPS